MYVLGRGEGGGLMNRDLRSDQLTSPPQIPRRENNTYNLNKQIWGGEGAHTKQYICRDKIKIKM
jgi:hypothetical protein